MMRTAESPLLEERYPRSAPLRCPEGNSSIDLTTALLGDWDDPARRLGCPHCGLWLVRNARTHTDWKQLLCWGVVLLLLFLGALAWAVSFMDGIFARSIAQALLIGAAVVAGRWIEHRTCFFVGPPLLPADGMRANVGRRA